MDSDNADHDTGSAGRKKGGKKKEREGRKETAKEEMKEKDTTARYDDCFFPFFFLSFRLAMMPF